MKSVFKKIINLLCLGILFLIMAIAMTGMPIKEIGQNYSGETDALLVSWIWSWEMYTLPVNPMGVFDANIFAPSGNTLAFSEHMFGSLLIAWPIFLITKNIIATFNIVVLLTFVISGIGGYLLGLHFSKNKWIAFGCGFLYAFVPYKLHHAFHINLSGMWLPYALLYLEKFLNKDSWKNILLLSMFIYLVFLNAMQFIAFLPWVLIIIALGRLALGKFRFNKSNITKIALSLIGLMILAAPILWPYIQLKKVYGFARSLDEMEGLSPDIIDYFISPFFYKYFYAISHMEWKISPGIFFLILLGLALFIITKRNKEKLREMFPYLFVGLSGILLSFGYYIQFTRVDKGGIMGPLGVIYTVLPFLQVMRSTGRLSIFFILMGIIIIAIGARQVWENKKYKLLLITIFLLAGFEFSLVDANFRSAIDTKTINPVYKWMREQPDNDIYLEMPFGLDYLEQNWDSLYIFNSRHHWKRLVNGYSGFETREYLNINNELKHFDVGDLETMRKYGVTRLVFHFDKYPPEFREKTHNSIIEAGHAKVIYTDDANVVYQLR